MRTIKDALDQPSLEQLRKAYAEIKTGRGLVFFVGSGLSRDAGLPDWVGLAAKLAAQCKSTTEINQFSQAKLGQAFNRMMNEESLWKKFEYIKEILGKTTFSSSIRDILSTDGKIIPRVYEKLCSMRCSGFISLNIDDFLLRSMISNINRPIYPVYGKDATERLPELLRNTPYLYQPHGIITTESSWVFTETDFNELCKSSLHDEFLTSVFLRDTVVFIGISANDVGASLRLANLIKRGIVPSSHFWIASDSHVEKREWAENHGIQQIIYPSAEGHEKSIVSILDSVSSYRQKEEIINNPIIGINNKSKNRSDIAPNELFKLDDIDEIRITLNQIILDRSHNGEISYADYSDICRQYSRAIHSCYMMPSGDVGEKWFGYGITGPAIGGKTMGRVVPAINDDGVPVAIKILDQRRYSDSLYLSAFRRGIKALKILRERKVDGIVPILDAYEVPPTIIMEYINCTSLQDAIDGKAIRPLNALKIVREAADIILAAHLLPEIVLHRDIRPSNILIEDFDWQSGDYKDIKVTDFELAWHKGALGDDFIRSERESLGYQAPEQISGLAKELRRTTLVDSYGLGATLYFCISGSAPPVNANKDSDWFDSVRRYAQRRFSNSQEVVSYVSRIITQSMSEIARDRISVSEIKERIDDLILWCEFNFERCSSDFLAEMLCSISAPGKYSVDDRGKIFSFNTTHGFSVSIRYDFLGGYFAVAMDYAKPGNVNNTRADKALNKLKLDIDSFLRVDGILSKKFTFPGGSREFSLNINFSSESIRKNLKSNVDIIKDILQRLNIS